MSCEQRIATNTHRYYGRFVPGLDRDGLHGINDIDIAIVPAITAVVFVSAIAAAVSLAVGLFGRQVRSATMNPLPLHPI